ncbi:MAG: SAM-dependent chlorinase/fluorinase [Actinomycetota bacterium]
MGTSPQEVITKLVTFSSDYGPTDEYVGVCRLVIAGIAPEVRIVDLVHGIRGVRAGATLLRQSLPFAPTTAVHLAVVDPGVGTQRRAVVIQTNAGALLVGPDNGLLPPAADALGGAVAAHELTEERYQLAPLSSTFHGRDVFAPAAAHLALGVTPEAFGPAVDIGDLVRLRPAHVDVSTGKLTADVLRVDWYGNLQLAATDVDLATADFGDELSVSNGAESFDARLGRTFADGEPGALVVYIDSGGHVAVACNGSSARELLGDPAAVTITS